MNITSLGKEPLFGLGTPSDLIWNDKVSEWYGSSQFRNKKDNPHYILP